MVFATTRMANIALPLLLSLLLVHVSIVKGVADGGACRKDSDCDGKLNCIRTGLVGKNCFPIDCAKGAAYALLESGFDPESYLNFVKGKTNLRNPILGSILDDTTTTATSVTTQQTLKQVMAKNPPPSLDVFKANYTACMYGGNNDDSPASENDERRRRLQSLTYVGWGYQWSAGLGAEYFGKASWIEYYGSTIEVSANCGAAVIGLDFGLDLLLQIISSDESRSPRPEGGDGGPIFLGGGGGGGGGGVGTTSTASDNKGQEFPFGNTYYFPVFTLGPFGLQVGWFNSDGQSGPSFVELTLGPSCGLALLGYTQCWNAATLI